MTRLGTQEVLQRFTSFLRHQKTDLLKITGDEAIPISEFGTGDSALTFKDVSYSVRRRRKEDLLILDKVSGHFEPGSLVAVMGPSGSGKSTLLEILAGKRAKNWQGTIHVNGRPRDRLFPRITAFVPQHDIMPAHITVEEAVKFHKCLKNERPSKFKSSMCQMQTDQQLEVLGLTEVKSTFVGDEYVRGISGGQKRRLSLARGLASGAQIIFCDEPTSGLSSTDAEACVKYMRLVTHKYRVTIIVVIHQPRREVARLFDDLILLTASPGRAVYNGPMRDLSSYLEKVGFPAPPRSNVADFVMDLVTPNIHTSKVEPFLEYFQRECHASILSVVDRELHNDRLSPLETLANQRVQMLKFGDMPPLRNSKYGVPFRKQLYFVLRRQITLRFRDKGYVIGDVVAAIVKALVVGIAYLGIGEKGALLQTAYFFMTLMTSSIDGLKSMPTVMAERQVMKMETSEALYSQWAYIIAFTLINTLQSLITNSLFLVLLFSLSGLRWGMFAAFYLWMTMLYFTMEGLYLMVGALMPDTTSAQIASLPFLMIFLLYNGFTVTRLTVTPFMAWAVHVSPVAYAMEGLVVAAQDVYHDRAPEFQKVVEQYGYKQQLGIGIEVMSGCLLLFRAVQVLGLRFLHNAPS